MVYSGDLTIRSGGPKPSLTPFHSLSVTSGLRGRQILRIALHRSAVNPADNGVHCSSVSDMSFLNFCTPTPRSMCHGGICRVATRSLMERAQGRASWKVISDMGAIEFG